MSDGIAIYALHPLHDMTQVYIGQTNDPKRRFKEHKYAINHPERDMSKRAKFFRSVLKDGDEIVMTILDVVPVEAADEAEQEYIERYGTLNSATAHRPSKGRALAGDYRFTRTPGLTADRIYRKLGV